MLWKVIYPLLDSISYFLHCYVYIETKIQYSKIQYSKILNKFSVTYLLRVISSVVAYRTTRIHICCKNIEIGAKPHTALVEIFRTASNKLIQNI